MSIIYLVGALVFLVILGYLYLVFVTANRERGVTRIAGQTLSGLLVLVLALMILLYQTGIASLPSFMPERPTTRIMRGMSAYVTGMMLEDEKAIDEFVGILKANPALLEKFQAKLK